MLHQAYERISFFIQAGNTLHILTQAVHLKDVNILSRGVTGFGFIGHYFLVGLFFYRSGWQLSIIALYGK
jgi:hypothetical protein